MSASPPSSSPSVSRLTGFVLGLVVLVCMLLIGGAGYVKYEMDRADSILVAPDAAFVTDQEAVEQLRRALGYSGFVGFAHNYAATHDTNIISDMRAQIKIANEMVGRLPEKTPGASRHDMQAILDVFQEALTKAEKSNNDPLGFTQTDMAPLYAALPVLDARIESAAASNRLAAQGQMQFWSMLLTLVSWCSLIIASALVAGIYLTLRGRNSAPLRALAQSVKNMARGDMRSSIWGMERQDLVGELARTIDLARYNFSQLPDMSLLSEQGPVRLRFEGNTRSLFEAMMRVISRDSEHVRQQAGNLTEAITKQQEAIALISSRVEAVLHNVEKRGLDGDQQVRQVLQTVTSSAQSLRNAQEHAADQLNRILPYLQERAQGMAEITQITGKQVSQALASLTISERGLRTSADQSEEAVKKLSSVADNLGERMFGAVNLLQASGKILAESTEKTQSRLNDAIAMLSDIKMSPSSINMQPQGPTILDVSPRLEQIASALESAQKRLDERLQQLAQITQSTAPQQIITPVENTAISDHLLAEIKAGFEATTHQIEQVQGQYAALQELALSRPPIEVRVDAQPEPQQPSYVRDLVIEIKTGFETINRQVGQMREQMTMANAAGQSTNIAEQMQTQWYQMAGQIEATRAAIEQTITQQMESIGARIDMAGSTPTQVDPAAFSDAQKQMEQQTQILEELVATLGMLDTHMQQLKSAIGH